MTASALSRPGERDRPLFKFLEVDWVFCLLLCLIAGAGSTIMYFVAGESWTPWAATHLMRYGILFVAMIVLAMVPLRWWFEVSYPVYAVGLLLLIGVELFGDVSKGAQRWLSIGGFRFQPSEIMKVGIVLALARFYHGVSAESARMSWWLLIPLLMIALPTLLVAHQPDLGTAILIGATGVAVMVLAGLDWRLIGGGVLATLAALPPFIFFVLHDYQRKRILTFLNPEADPSGDGYHILQSKIALGSGGFLGKGLGLGSQSQLDYLPEKHTDFIYSALSEQLGFLGAATIIVLYAGVIYMALRIASTSHSHFGRLGSAGVTATFALYVLINGAMVMGMAPVVGVPMPLLSYGGTVMMTVMIGFGLVLSTRVHRYSEVTSGRGSLL